MVVQVLWQSFARTLPSEAELDAARAETRVSEWMERVSAAWPELDVEALQHPFLEHLGTLASDTSDPLGLIEDRAIEELFLCFACARGVEAALRRFEDEFRATLQLTYAARRGASVEMDEFVQSVRVRLFVGERPKILSFEGRGPLRAWVKMVAARRLADLAQSDRATRNRSINDDLLLSRMTPAKDLSTRFIQARHRDDVQDAVRRALQRLDPSRRILLRQRFVFGLALAELAQLHGVHRVTISKRLARAKHLIFEGLREELRAQLSVDADIESIARICLSQLDMSLGPLLDSRSIDER